MGKNRLRMIILFGIVLLIILTLGANKIINKMTTQKPTTVFKNLNQEQVSDILVQNDLKETRIYQKNSQWKVQKNGFEYDADPDKINAIITAFINLQKGETVSNNTDKRGEFGIGKQKLMLKTKFNSYVVYIGKNATLDTVYVALDDNSEIFIATGLSDLFSSDDYRNLNPHLITDENKVSLINLQYPDHALNLQKQGDDWFSMGQKLNKEKVDFFINDIKMLKASDMMPVTQVNVLLYPLSFSLVITENQQKITADIYQKDTDTYYVKPSNADLLYQISNAYVSSLQKEEKDFTN